MSPGLLGDSVKHWGCRLIVDDGLGKVGWGGDELILEPNINFEVFSTPRKGLKTHSLVGQSLSWECVEDWSNGFTVNRCNGHVGWAS